MKSNASPRSPGVLPLPSRAKWLPLVALVAAAALLVVMYPLGGEAATAPTLGTAASYSVLANTTVTNTGATTLSGNLGIHAGSGDPPHYTGFPPGVVLPPGVIHDADAAALQAQSDNTSAFGQLDQTCDTTYGGNQDLTLVSPLEPGVYCAVAFSLSGNLTLSGSGVWIFKAASTLITSPGSSVTGGDPCSIWWRIGSSATLDTTTSFRGSILALASITLNTGATINGRLLAQTGAVTLQSNVISGPNCVSPSTSTPTSTNTAGPTTNTPSSTNTPPPGSTNTPTSTATSTSTPTNTPPPGSTNTPTSTATSTSTPTNTPQPGSTNTPTSTATNTATPTNTPIILIPNSTNTATSTPTNTLTPGANAVNTASVTRTSTRTPVSTTQVQVFSTSTVIPTSTAIATATPVVETALATPTAASSTTTSVGSPPQSPVETLQTTVVSTPLGVARPPQSPSFLPPSAGDGGLIQRRTAETHASGIVLMLMVTGTIAAWILLSRKRKV